MGQRLNLNLDLTRVMFGCLWLGAKRQGVTTGLHEFQWVDGSGFDFEDWVLDEPNGENGNAGSICIVDGLLRKGKYGWNDMSCNSMKKGYTCKKLASGT